MENTKCNPKGSFEILERIYNLEPTQPTGQSNTANCSLKCDETEGIGKAGSVRVAAECNLCPYSPR